MDKETEDEIRRKIRCIKDKLCDVFYSLRYLGSDDGRRVDLEKRKAELESRLAQMRSLLGDKTIWPKF